MKNIYLPLVLDSNDNSGADSNLYMQRLKALGIDFANPKVNDNNIIADHIWLCPPNSVTPINIDWWWGWVPHF